MQRNGAVVIRYLLPFTLVLLLCSPVMAGKWDGDLYSPDPDILMEDNGTILFKDGTTWSGPTSGRWIETIEDDRPQWEDVPKSGEWKGTVDTLK